MTVIYQNPTLHIHKPGKTNAQGQSYSGYVEPDTDIPKKPAAVIQHVTVNGTVITEMDIMAEAQNHPAETPGGALTEAARALVVRELLLQEAARLNILAVPEPRNTGASETPEDAKIRILIEQEIRAPQATDEECKRFYQRNRKRFNSETIYEARHILLAVEEGNTEARATARSKAEKLARHLTEYPGEFADAAGECSDCPSRQQGGNLGQLTTGSTVSEFERALETMTADGSAPVLVESRFGIHLVVLDRKIDGETLPFELVRERIAAWLEAATWSKAVEQYISLLAGQADIRGIDIEGAQGSLVQ